MNKFRVLLGVIFLLLFSLIAFYLGQQFGWKKTIKLCTLEARLCPDGSSVSRTGPNCEFAPCPISIDNLVTDKIHPDLAEWLKTAKDDDSIKITLWIKDDSLPLQTTRPPPNQEIDQKQLDDFLKKVDQENTERVKRVMTPVVEKLTRFGYEVETNSSEPILYMTATKKFILKLVAWEEILSIDRGDRVNLPLKQECGGWDTSGEIICECAGRITKSDCPTGVFCDAGTYFCDGECGQCCYKGVAENAPYPNCK